MRSNLRIDFIQPSKPGRWAWGGCAVLALVCAGSITVDVRERKQIEDVRQDIETLKHQQRLHATTLVPRSATKAPPYDADARTMLRELGFPTKEALTALENVAVVGVTPTTFDLQANTGVIRIQVEFTDQESLLTYLAQLNAGEEQPRWAVVQVRAGSMATKGTATLQSKW